MFLWAIYLFPQSICLPCFNLYIPIIDLPSLLQELCEPILWIYKLLTDTWMWKLGLRPHNSQKRNTNCKWGFRYSADSQLSLQVGDRSCQRRLMGHHKLTKNVINTVYHLCDRRQDSVLIILAKTRIVSRQYMYTVWQVGTWIGSVVCHCHCCRRWRWQHGCHPILGMPILPCDSKRVGWRNPMEESGEQ